MYISGKNNGRKTSEYEEVLERVLKGRTRYKGKKLIHKNAIDMRTILLVIGIISMINIGYLLIYYFSDAAMIPWVNKLFPIVVLFLLLWAGFNLIAKYRIMIWSPLPWFFATSAIYFGFGPLIYYYGSIESIQYIDQFYPVNEGDLLRTNILNGIGILLVVIGYYIAAAKIFPISIISKRNYSYKEIKKMIIIFLVTGASIKYLWALPYEFGLITIVIPGSLREFQYLTTLALIPIMYLIYKGHKDWKIVFYLLIAVEIIVAFLEFSKMSMIVTLIILFLGWFMCKPEKKILIGGFLSLLICYYAIVPIIPFGRGEISKISGTHYEAGFNERIKIMKNYILNISENKNNFKDSINDQSWWTRLNYTNAQNFVMNEFDRSNPGDSFEEAIYAFVPRFLWLDKPVMSDIGLRFNYLVNRNPFSSSSPGLFAEAYWNGGWLLVVLSCVYVGMLFAWFTKYSIQKIGSLRFAFLPVIFIGLKMGYRADGWFVIEYIGPLIIAIFMHYIMKLLSIQDKG